MRLLATFLLAAVGSPLLARPLAFEQRTPARFEARLGHAALIVRPDAVTLGNVVLRFVKASSSAHLDGIGPSSPATYVSAAGSRTFVQFPKVALRGIYPGVDVILYGNGDHLEYDLVVSPGADLHRLKLRFEGARKVAVDRRGDLQIDVGSGSMIQKLPRVFQPDGRPIPAAYALLSKGEIGFRIGPHNPRLRLTIDPELVFTKYFGGSGSDTAYAVATDAQGNVYVAGTSNSVDFPTTGSGSRTPAAPLASISGGGANVAPLPVGTETSVLAIGGTSDGALLYALTPDATYLSTDSGATWTRRGPPLSPAATGFQRSGVNRISVDAVDPSRLFAATSGGLFFSSDGGQSWGLHNFGLPTGPSGSVNAGFVAVSPLNHAIVYVATASPVGIFRSSDAGGNWTPLNPTYPGQPQTPGYQSYVAELGPNGSDLFVIDPYGALLKSTDAGTTWQLLNQQLYGAQAMVIDPSNASNLYVMSYSGIQRSSDGGATFTTLVPASAVAALTPRIALDAASGTLYYGSNSGSLNAIPVAGGVSNLLPLATPNLHALVTLGSQVYAGFDSPTVPYVIKWDSTGTNILYSTFFGGTRQDTITGLAVDTQGECTVAGYTYSPDFPVTARLSDTPPGINSVSGFATRLSADGTRIVFSSLLPGSSGAAGTIVQALAIDASGATYLTGQAALTGFPVTNGAFQTSRPQTTCSRPQSGFLGTPDTGANAFVSKISPDGNQLIYSTWITGSCGSSGQGIAVNLAGEAVVVGYTPSSDFPAAAGSYQPAFPGDAGQTLPPNPLTAGFAARVSAAGDRLIAATYLGGSYATRATAVTLDAAGNVYLTGTTAKILPGATPGAYQTTVVDRCAIPLFIGPAPPYGGTNDAFALKLDPTLSTAGYLTYLGGGCDDSGNGIALDSSGNAWIVGITQSPDFPLKSPFQGAGLINRFVAEISSSGSQLLFSSSTDGGSLAIDPAGSVYLAGSGTSPAVPKRTQFFGGLGTSAELDKIDPSQTPGVIIDNVQPVAPYLPVVLSPSNLGSGMAPGQYVRISGRNLGPATQATGQADGTGRMPFTLAGTTVLFDNFPAPLVSVQDTSILCFVPFEVSQISNVVVQSKGQRSNSVRLGITATNLQILTVANQDGSVNSADHPAHPGEELVFYVSGLGQTTPLSADGLLNTPPIAMPLALVTAFVGDQTVQPDFVGAAPGQVAGIVQINLRLGSSSYSSNPVGIALNNASALVYVTQ